MYSKYQREEGHKTATKAYSVWNGIKGRKATMCHTWNDYQVFAMWYHSQVGHTLDYQVDKDLLTQGNRHYSPDTCLLLPSTVNNHLNIKLNKVERTLSLIPTLAGYPLDKRIIPALHAWAIN